MSVKAQHLLIPALLLAASSGCAGDDDVGFADGGPGVADADLAEPDPADAASPDAHICDEGYAGDNCDGCAENYLKLDDGSCIADPCRPDTCATYGQCQADSESGVASCQCETGYVGPRCEDCAATYFALGERCVDQILFALPVANPGGSKIDSNVIGFDHNPAPGWSDIDCLSFDGLAFPSCYDQHTGSDFILTGGFPTMDAGSTEVIAAAAGEVIAIHDGEFDRCQANIITQDIECPGYAGVTPANYVKLRHADGVETFYWHLMKDSIIVAVGELVECGQMLGQVGSSGRSAMPHLHFTLVDSDGTRIDPFAGTYSQPQSYWVSQDDLFGLPGATCQ